MFIVLQTVFVDNGIMSWQDLSTQIKYTSPSGKEFSFHYDSGLQRETDLKTATFTFPSKDGAYIQSLGRGGRRFPFSCSFYGANCIKDADAFEAALCETGYGNLEYPTGEQYKVVPTGVIKRTDDLVAAANQSTVEITFAETITDEKFPADATQTNDAIAEAEEAFAEAAAKEFAESLVIENTSELLNAKAVLSEQGTEITQSLEDIAELDPDLSADFTAAKKSWIENIKNFASKSKDLARKVETYVDKANTIAAQGIKLIRMPSKIAVSALAKVEGYASITNSLVKNFAKDPVGLNNLKNQFAATKLQLQSLVVSVAAGIAALTNTDESSGGFASREDAVTTALQIAELTDTVQDFCDKKIDTIQKAENEKESGKIFAETADAYIAMQEVVKLAVTSVLNYSFTLKTRRIITLDRDRQLLELLAELYGSVDDHIDEFIRDNKLNINEIALLPEGREITYYE